MWKINVKNNNFNVKNKKKLKICEKLILTVDTIFTIYSPEQVG